MPKLLSSLVLKDLDATKKTEKSGKYGWNFSWLHSIYKGGIGREAIMSFSTEIK